MINIICISLRNLVPFMITICHLTVTMTSILLVVQERLTLPGYPSSPPILSWVPVHQTLVFCIVFCRWSFMFFVPFHLAIALPVVRFTAFCTLWYLQLVLEMICKNNICRIKYSIANRRF